MDFVDAHRKKVQVLHFLVASLEKIGQPYCQV